MTNPNYEASFDGDVYQPALDDVRLKSQLQRIYELMKDSRWRTVQDISVAVRAPSASVLAQLGHLRKAKFGAYLVEKRRVTDQGLWEYRVRGKGEGVPKKRTCGNCQEMTDAMRKIMATSQDENVYWIARKALEGKTSWG